MADVQSWDSFALMIGSASGALTGLLFVSVQLNRDHIVRHPQLRASAAETLMLLVLPLVICALLLTPEQPAWALGTELIVLALGTAALLWIVGRPDRKASTAEASRLAALVEQRGTKIVTTLFLLIAGVTHIAGHGGGLYWLVPTVLFALLAGILNAWFFLFAETT
jgi:hypothetical protein